MASVGMAPTSGLRESSAAGVDKLPEEMNDMKIRDDKVCISLFDVFLILTIMIPCFCIFFSLIDIALPNMQLAFIKKTKNKKMQLQLKCIILNL